MNWNINRIGLLGFLLGSSLLSFTAPSYGNEVTGEDKPQLTTVEDVFSTNAATLLADSPIDPSSPDFGVMWNPGRPDSHAPIGVMGDHTHEKNEVMFSYRYMRMRMDGNRDGTDELSASEVLEDFRVTPLDMTTEMHMFGAMYAPLDDLTLSLMVPYISKTMDHRTRMGGEFTTESSGIGDLKLGGLYKVYDSNNQHIHLNAGLSFPTGSIDERDRTPAGPNQPLPYPMQIGSGTYDLHPGITYLGQAGDWSWGAQGSGIIRLGENSRDYRLGHRLDLTGWGARRWNDSFSTSLRLKGSTIGDYDGADDRLNPALIPTADPDRRGGQRLDLGLGVNFLGQQGFIKGHRIGLELGLPIYQSLDGPQLQSDWMLTVGWQKAFAFGS